MVLRAVLADGGGGEHEQRGDGGERGAPHDSSRTRQDVRAHPGLVHGAALGRGDPALPVDQERLGVLDHAEALEPLAVLVLQHRVAELVLADEVLRARGDVEHVHAEHGASLALEAAVPALEQRRLGPAGLAPRGPEVEDHDLAAVVGERAGAVAAQPGQLELGRRLPLAGGERLIDAAVRIGLGEPVREQRDERHEDANDGDRNGGETLRMARENHRWG